MKMIETGEKLAVLRQEVDTLKKRIGDHATGHIYTAISVIEQRIKELEDEFENEQRQRNR